MKDNYYPIMVLLISITIALGIISYTNAQTSNEDKTYERCTIDTSILDAQNLSYDVECNTERITIHNWQDISSLDRTAIESSLTSQGFTGLNITSEVNQINR